MKIVDKGRVNWIEDIDQFCSFEFKGKILKGYVTLRRESADADIWVMRKAALPGERRKEEVTVVGGVIISSFLRNGKSAYQSGGKCPYRNSGKSP